MAAVIGAGSVGGARAADAVSIAGSGYTAHADDSGGLVVQAGPDTYRVTTRLSAPGDTIGWNVLSGGGASSDPAWRPRARRVSPRVIEWRASGAHYAVRRTVTALGARLRVSEIVTNTGREDVAVQVRHDLTCTAARTQILLSGAQTASASLMAENPSVFVSAAGSGIGWLASDAVLRLQLAAAVDKGTVHLSVNRFALRPGASHTFEWFLYPQAGAGDYWAFANRVRRDWGSNFTVQGPFDFLDLTKCQDILHDPARLREFLHRRKLKVIAFQPWVDYENYDARTGRPVSRDELRVLAREAMAAIKAVDPTVLCIGCIEGNLVAIPPDAQRALWDSAPNRPQEQYPLSDEQMAILRRFDLPWKDCMLQSKDGRCRYELYYRGEGARRIPMIALAVYAAPGNGQHRYWLDQARYLLEDVGLDGLYVDQFNMAFSDSQRYSYEVWDGTTVDVDPATGRIARRYTDAGLVGIGARRSLANYALKHGRYVLANTFPATAEMQSVRMHRFNESEWDIDVFKWKEGTMPPLAGYPCQGHFSTPVSLGVRPFRYGQEGIRRSAEVVMRAVITYLRHGLVYYHYGSDLPAEGAGVYDAVARMFPITPVELRPGAVIGRERVAAAVSGEYPWLAAHAPTVRVYDLQGRCVQSPARVLARGGSRRVVLTLRDWQEVAIVE